MPRPLSITCSARRSNGNSYCGRVGVLPRHALYAPKGTPKAAIDKLVAALQEAVKDDTVKKRFADLGADAYPADKATPAALASHLRAELAKWGPIIKKAGVYAD